MGLILLIVLIIVLFGGLGNLGGGPGYGYGPIGFGLPGILLLVVIILLVTGRL